MVGPSPKPPHFSLLRALSPADFFTLANAAAGTTAVFMCLRYVEHGHDGWLWAVFVLLPVAFVCDAFDGWIARRQRRESALGAELDSLADIISFGVAPAVLGYTLGLRGAWDAAVLVYFVVCGVSRLARFNVTATTLTDPNTGKVRYFEGTPIPTSLVIVALLGVAFALDATGPNLWGGALRIGPWVFHPLVLVYAASGTAMASATLRIPKP